MHTLSFPKSALRPPEHSAVTIIRIEDGIDCDGLYCLGRENAVSVPHRHWVISGRDPDAGPRRYFHADAY